MNAIRILRNDTGGRFLLLPALTALLTVLSACGTDEPAAPDDAYARATQFVYDGGMGAGKRAGRTIYRDGRFEFWKSDADVDGGARVVQRSAQLRPEQVEAVFAAAREIVFLEIDFDASDDFGMAMEMIGPDGSHRVAWARAGDAPPSLRKIADAIALLK